jgi:hypothetical protein
MGDDWRLRIDLHESGIAHSLTERLEASKLEHQLESSFQDRVAVSVDGSEVFCYTGTREQADRAEQLIRSLASEHGWHLTTELKHWHPVAEEWEDPDAPLPTSDAEITAEHEELIEQEREDAESQGYPDFEVRVRCSSPVDAEKLEAMLKAEGLTAVRRSNYLFLGTADEDSANTVADRIRREAPGTTVVVEASSEAVYEDRPPNPFGFFGGMAG